MGNIWKKSWTISSKQMHKHMFENGLKNESIRDRMKTTIRERKEIRWDIFILQDMDRRFGM